MLLRLLSIVALLSAAHAVNPCTGKQTTGCNDLIDSCAAVFVPGAGGAPSDKCFDKKDGDFPMTTLCHKTCQLCCQEPQYNCDDDPIATIACPSTQEECNQFSDINFLHCQSTCGWCNLQSKPCVDSLDSATCKLYKDAAGDLCSNNEVSASCEKTCGVCVSAECKDASTRCPIWTKNNFCTNPFYTADRETYCKESCDLC